MTYKEFSQNFDVLYTNSTSGLAPGLTEYEKSIFLTKAQNEIVKNHFNANSNDKKEGYGDTSKRDIDFSCITSFYRYRGSFDEIGNNIIEDEATFAVNKSIAISLPSDMIAIINEDFYISSADEVTYETDLQHFAVIPIKPEVYSILMAKPWQGPKKRQVWRMLHNTGIADNTAELIFSYPLYKKLAADFGTDIGYVYTVRYIQFPPPIITINLNTGFSIQGRTSATTSILPKELHEEIVQRAVEIAKNLWSGDLNTLIQLGQRSE